MITLPTELTHEELIELGHQIEPTLVHGMSRTHDDGTVRPLTNREMAAFLAARSEERWIEFQTARWIIQFQLWADKGCPLHIEVDRQWR